jgi:hypothetical protein
MDASADGDEGEVIVDTSPVLDVSSVHAFLDVHLLICGLRLNKTVFFPFKLRHQLTHTTSSHPHSARALMLSVLHAFGRACVVLHAEWQNGE